MRCSALEIASFPPPADWYSSDRKGEQRVIALILGIRIQSCGTRRLIYIGDFQQYTQTVHATGTIYRIDVIPVICHNRAVTYGKQH